MSIGGGLNNLFDLTPGPILWLFIAAAIVGTFVVSSISGVTKGIRILSDINTKIFFGILAFLVIVGPTAYCISLGVQGVGDLFNNFFQKSLFTGTAGGDTWPQWWTCFYWAADIAWTPLIAVFLGQISVGYRVRDFMLTCFILPSIFEIFWMTIFGGNALRTCEKCRTARSLIHKVLKRQRILFSKPSLASIVIPVFVITMFISFVTAADSMTLSGLCSTGISPRVPEAKKWVKIVWGLIMVQLLGYFYRGWTV